MIGRIADFVGRVILFGVFITDNDFIKFIQDLSYWQAMILASSIALLIAAPILELGES
jgi:hypothetical protein